MDELQQKFQRDINRCSDSDRNMRKRGLQKLYQELPWGTKDETQRITLQALCCQQLFRLLLPILSDPIEKCREHTIGIYRNMIQLCSGTALIDEALTSDLIRGLCSRVGEIPFPEQGEELRLQIVELLQIIFSQSITNQYLTSLSDTVFQTMAKGFQDTFPSVKRCWSEILISLAKRVPSSIQSHYKILLKGLVPNSTHQHHKVRSITMKGLAAILSCIAAPLSDESVLYIDKAYLSVMTETLLPILSKGVGDRSTGPRIAIAKLCSGVISKRIQAGLWYPSNTSFNASMPSQTQAAEKAPPSAFSLSQEAAESFASSLSTDVPSHAVDTELLSDLVLLIGDPDETVSSTGRQCLDSVCASWISLQGSMEVVDSETSVVQQNESFLDHYGKFVLDMLCKAVLSGWTTEIRLRILRGIDALLKAVETYCFVDKTSQLITGDLMPQTLNALSQVITDEEVDVRCAAEKTLQSIGRICCEASLSNILPELPLDFLLNFILPRSMGEIAGMDTSHHRKCGLLILTQIVHGMAIATKTSETQFNGQTQKTIQMISTVVAQPSLYEYRDKSLLEAALLVNRAIRSHYASTIAHSMVTEEKIATSLVYLSGRCEYEDSLISSAAKSELLSLAEKTCSAGSDGVRELLGKHFTAILSTIMQSPPSSWTGESPHRAAFEALIRSSVRHAWIHSDIVLNQIIVPLVQPKPAPEKGSQEEIAASYAASRGDLDESLGKIDLRLSTLAILETMFRFGSMDWECGKYFAEHCEMLLEKALLPNLVWRAGRVEGVTRKVALTATHGLLKAGGVPPQSLFRSAPQLVPLLASDLDDSDATSRHLGTLCLDIIFDRLKGAFGEQAIHDLYPKLLKRLDDSEDSIRISICKTLRSFLLCATPECYRGTTIDYTLDQLFIHLDDPDPSIQKPVFEVIIQIAESIDAKLVLRKAQNNLQTHRTPAMCEAVIETIQRIGIA